MLGVFMDDIINNKCSPTGALLGNFIPFSHGCVVCTVLTNKDS